MIAAKDHIQRLRAYEPGKQPREGEQVVKLNTNENPYPPSPWVLEAIHEEANAALRLYPDPLSQRLREAVASAYGVLPGQVLCGNGSDELFGILLRTFTSHGDRIGFYEPSYSYYRTLGSVYDRQQCPTPLGRDFATPPLPADPDLALFFLTNPHSPLGFSLRPEFVSRLARHLRGILVIDEAYADFARWNCLSLLREFPNVVITRSLSKSYSLAGLRVGLALAAESHIEQMHKARDHYNLNRIAQAAASVALRDQVFFEENRRRVLRTRDRFIKAVHALGLETVNSDANFVFARCASSATAARVYQALTAGGILVRYFDQDGLSDGLRITVGTDRDMDRLLAELGTLLREP